MTPEQVFAIVNPIAALGWVLLAIFPRRPLVTHTLIGTGVPVAFAILYAVIVAAVWTRSEGGFNSLDHVALLFQNRWMLLAGWVHYLAFDLLVGRWEVLDANARRIPRVLVVPCLAMTFMFGPAGWGLYRIVRAMHGGGSGDDRLGERPAGV